MISPGLSGGNEELLDPGAELLAVDRPVECARRDETVLPQRAYEGRRRPMAPRNGRDEALAAVIGLLQSGGLGVTDEHRLDGFVEGVADPRCFVNQAVAESTSGRPKHCEPLPSSMLKALSNHESLTRINEPTTNIADQLG
jgi:hypothetical protein